jgi:hypothetical protein
MSDDPDQTLPRLSFLLAQRAAHVREHNQGVRNTSLAKGSAAHEPPRATRERQGNQSFVLAG